MHERLVIELDSKPRLPRGVRLRFDDVRARHVLLAPERVLMPDAISVAILLRCDGATCVESLSQQLSEVFDAPLPEIRGDVLTHLQSLADKGLVRA